MCNIKLSPFMFNFMHLFHVSILHSSFHNSSFPVNTDRSYETMNKRMNTLIEHNVWYTYNVNSSVACCSVQISRLEPVINLRRSKLLRFLLWSALSSLLDASNFTAWSKKCIGLVNTVELNPPPPRSPPSPSHTFLTKCISQCHLKNNLKQGYRIR